MFEAHKDFGDVFYSAWNINLKEEADVDKVRKMKNAVSTSIKNFIKTTAVPHFQVNENLGLTQKKLKQNIFLQNVFDSIRKSIQFRFLIFSLACLQLDLDWS